MAKYGRKSKMNLGSCDPRLQEIFKEVIKIIDCSILCGHRPKADQNQAFEEGRSKVKFPHSKHNSLPSKAVDAVPYPIDWQDLNRFYHFAGIVKGVAAMLGYKVRWGRDWDSDNDFNDQTFNDYPHWEIVD